MSSRAQNPAEGDENEAELSEQSGEDAGGDSKKRKRPMSSSCETCKQRKVKCDKSQPACGWCSKNNQVCVYRERKKPGLRAGYGRDLEARIDRLEGVLQSHHDALQQLASSVSALRPGVLAAGTISNHPGENSYIETSRLSHPAATASSPSSVPSGVHGTHLSKDMSHEFRHFGRQASLPSSRGLTSTSVYAPSNPPVESPTLNIGQSHQLEGADHPFQDTDLPPYDLLYTLVELFFAHIYPWCPILHRETTVNTLFGSATLDEGDQMLLHAIVATTLRFSSDSRLDEARREQYHNISKQKVSLYGLENSSVKALQALAILALDVVGNSNGPPGWNLLALIARSAVQLGIAVEATSSSVAPLYPSIYTLRAMVLPEAKSFIEDESRRRLFWMIYVLDRYATISTAFDFALPDKEIERRLPCNNQYFERNQYVETKWFQVEHHEGVNDNQAANLGAFSYYVVIIGILTRIHRFLKEPVDISSLPDVEKWQSTYRHLDSQLRAWYFDLPNKYKDTSVNATFTSEEERINCLWVMLNVTYHTFVQRELRPGGFFKANAYPTIRSSIFSPSFSASQRCHSAAEEICTLCRYVKDNDMLVRLGPPFAFSLWVAARLLLVHGSTIDHVVNPAITLLVDTLQEMGCYWKVAARYATLLRRVLDEYDQSIRTKAATNGARAETPSTVRILADMRRCAYDLDFLISRQPQQPAVSVPPARTPARTPAPNELEYLDVFNFFNMPRLQYPANTGATSTAGADTAADFGIDYLGTNGNEFNITNFMYDIDTDWFRNPN